MASIVPLLHPNHLKILRALQSAARILDAKEHLWIVGSMADCMSGVSKRPGDIDALIDKTLCERYWEFVEILDLHGIKSVYDVIDRPSFPWTSCREVLAHAKAFTVDCCANAVMDCGMHHANLDILFDEHDLKRIPNSSNWVKAIDRKSYYKATPSEQAAAVNFSHQELVREIHDSKKELTPPTLHAELQLYYRLKHSMTVDLTPSHS